MSVTKQTTIWCDGCGDWDQASETAASFRKALRRKGWTNSGGTDLCPTCSKTATLPQRIVAMANRRIREEAPE